MIITRKSHVSKPYPSGVRAPHSRPGSSLKTFALKQSSSPYTSSEAPGKGQIPEIHSSTPGLTIRHETWAPHQAQGCCGAATGEVLPSKPHLGEGPAPETNEVSLGTVKQGGPGASLTKLGWR